MFRIKCVNNIDTSSNHVALNIDVVCPLEAGLIVPLIQMVVKELLPAQFRESDKDNNADDNSSEDYNRNGRQQNAIKMAQAKQQGLI